MLYWGSTAPEEISGQRSGSLANCSKGIGK
jgi:hypothetical protein